MSVPSVSFVVNEFGCLFAYLCNARVRVDGRLVVHVAQDLDFLGRGIVEL